MRWGVPILLSCVFVLGCATKSAQRPEPAPALGQLADDGGAITASLVFDPPLVASEPKIDISRAGRAPEAFAGFEEIITTYYYLRVDDRQLNYNGRAHDRFEREAITTRVGVTYR
jgi:hypothetical protein